MSSPFPLKSRKLLSSLLQNRQADFSAAIAQAVEQFYAKVAEYPELEIVLKRLGNERVSRLKAEQCKHSLSLLLPDDDDDFALRSQEIGKIHALMGIQSEWLINSMALYSDSLLDLLNPFFKDTPELRGYLLQRLATDLARQLQGMESAAQEERKILERIDLLLISDATPEESVGRMIDKLMSIPGLDGAWISHSDDGIHLLRDQVSGEELQEYLDTVEIRLDNSPFGQGPAGTAWRSGEIIYIDDWQTDPMSNPWRMATQKYGWRSNVTIPVKVNAKPYAVIALYSKIPGFFRAPNRQNLIRHLAIMLGIAIGRHQQQIRIDRLNSLYRAFLAEGDILIRARSETEILRKTCQHIVEGTLFKTAYVMKPDQDDCFKALAGAGTGSGILGNLGIQLFSDRPSLLRDTWQSERLQYRNDYRNDPAFSAQHNLMEQQNWASVAIIPIRRNGQIWAILGVTSSEKNIFDQEILGTLARVGKLIGYGLDEMDLKKRIDQERITQSWMARHDALTRLPNRVALLDRIPEAIQRTRREEKLLGICMLDLDDFKPVNDQHGHAAGDVLLQKVANRLGQALRQTDFVARVGGDEFALVLENIQNMEDVEKLMVRISEALERPYVLPGNITVKIGGSLGITIFPFDEGDSEILLRHADQALYVAKANKAERSHFWASFQGEEVFSGESNLPYLTLLQQDEGLIAYYQPILHLATGRIIGIEALARLRQGTEIILPDTFIPHLDSRAAQMLTSRILRIATRTAQQLHIAGFPLEVAVNIPPDALFADNFLPELQAVLADCTLAPEQLTLEILENGDFLSLQLAQEKIATIRSLGVRVALDDVGSAYASLLRLKEIAVDEVKLDQCLVRGIPEQPGDLIFVGSIAALALSMGSRYVVEGAETPETLDALAVLGVDCVQGYAIARPMPEESLLPWLQAWTPEPQNNQPKTLLGAYASHLQFDSLYQIAPAILGKLPSLDDAHNCRLGKYLDAHGLADSALATAHQAYHACISRKHSPEEITRLRKKMADNFAATHDNLPENRARIHPESDS
ncbi:EAL domain-containing protein [Acidithiobacillus thiooxidans]|uniref:EAL domain-containing protein n=1 Tax=Acidithiobacillus thiooxidans TaxID=930 RepID=UPI001C075026|nr:EAL domain-containing protein [Acidithiobacillus thiooxidans]MBU2812512.1 EAL domain-containing protein [Acidithiobacillus thiooxidans]